MHCITGCSHQVFVKQLFWQLDVDVALNTATQFDRTVDSGDIEVMLG
jgi:hypothetical protein